MIETGVGRAIPAEVVGFNGDNAVVMPFAGLDGVRRGCRALIANASGQVRPAASWLGRVINAMGEPIDGKGRYPGAGADAVRNSPPSAHSRKRVGKPLDLGVSAAGNTRRPPRSSARPQPPVEDALAGRVGGTTRRDRRPARIGAIPCSSSRGSASPADRPAAQPPAQQCRRPLLASAGFRRPTRRVVPRRSQTSPTAGPNGTRADAKVLDGSCPRQRRTPVADPSPMRCSGPRPPSARRH